MIDISEEACAVACMLVSNPQGALRKDGDGWQRRVNDLIRALRFELTEQRRFADAYCAQLRRLSDKCAQTSD